MSYFCNNPIYVIVPEVDANDNHDMINHSKLYFNTDYDKLRKSIDGTLVLFKARQPVSSIFNGYEWHNKDSIKTILATAAWEDPEV